MSVSCKLFKPISRVTSPHYLNSNCGIWQADEVQIVVLVLLRIHKWIENQKRPLDLCVHPVSWSDIININFNHIRRVWMSTWGSVSWTRGGTWEWIYGKGADKDEVTTTRVESVRAWRKSLVFLFFFCKMWEKVQVTYLLMSEQISATGNIVKTKSNLVCSQKPLRFSVARSH